MQYVKVFFEHTSPEERDILIALLADMGYDGFEEQGHSLLAYIEKPRFHEGELAAAAQQMHAAYTTEAVPAQNWNAVWESNFPPVILEGFCTIRASFHDIAVNTPYEIVITPKMSFGTGHHATTQLVMMLMRETDFKGRSVLDFGAGTGVLAILAELLGATDILAIDNDDWCVENARENVERNDCRHITVKKGSLDAAGMDKKDVILANINRHILLEHMAGLYARLHSGGTIIMSGLLAPDKDIVVAAAATEGFAIKAIKEQGGWVALRFGKI